MNFKCFIFALFLSLGFFNKQATAQDSSPNREIGLQFSNVNFSGDGAFSMFFKKEIKENVYRRIRAFYGNVGLIFSESNSIFNGSAGIAIGREKRKALDEKLLFYQGPEVSISAGASHNNFSVYSGNVRFGWVVGLQHSFNERWAINLEAIPGIGVGLSGASNVDAQVQTNLGLSSNVSLGIVRKF